MTDPVAARIIDDLILRGIDLTPKFTSYSPVQNEAGLGVDCVTDALLYLMEARRDHALFQSKAFERMKELGLLI